MWQPAVLLFVLSCVSAQNYRVCIPATDRTLCNSLDRDGSQAICEPVESRIDCAIKLARGAADIGVFNEEETLLLGQQQPNDNAIVATIRDVSRTEPYAFEAVAIVSNTHSGGLAGLKNGNYCHPGFDQSDQRWSPRVLKAFEQAVVGTDRCPGETPPGKTVEELETFQINEFFSHACRPGPWSYNASIDASLKTEFPNLCALCGTACTGYNLNTLVNTVDNGVNTNNRHIQALECLRTTQNSVAYVAWKHVQEFFSIRLNVATSYAVLCPDGTTRSLTSELLATNTSPCAFVRQPWSTIVTNSQNAAAILSNLRTWWPEGGNPGGSTWQAVLYNGIVGGSNARVVFETGPVGPLNYTAQIRPIPAVDATASCLPARRWCTLSTAEHTKCQWVSAAAHSLGLQPAISCQQRAHIFECLADIKENRLDFVASKSNYGYLARQHYQLSPVKLVQNSRSAANGFSRVAAFVKESHAQGEVTRFENLKGKTACFPEYGGIAFVAFIRAAQERGVISASECEYARAAGELFGAACAPGASDATHSLNGATGDYNATHLCSACQSAVTIVGNYSNNPTCAWDYSNRYFGNNGSLLCLTDPNTHVAVLQTQNIQAHLSALGLDPNQFRALCRNNTLAASTGVNIDDGCLLAHVVDAEVVTRRNDPLSNALSVLLETLDIFFGYNAESHAQLINLEIFSPFDGTSDLLFKDSAIGFTEPSVTSSNTEARNYIELFTHLESCTGNSATDFGVKNMCTLALTVLMVFITAVLRY